MTALVNNLLDMARLESGAIALARAWTPLEEIVGSVLGRLREALAGIRSRSRCRATCRCSTSIRCCSGNCS